MEYPAWEESYGGRRTWATTNINNAHAAGWLLYKQIVLSRPGGETVEGGLRCCEEREVHERSLSSLTGVAS